MEPIPNSQAIRKNLKGLRSLLCSKHTPTTQLPFKDLSSGYKLSAGIPPQISPSPAYSLVGHRYGKMLGYVSWMNQIVSKHLVTTLYVITSPLCANE